MPKLLFVSRQTLSEHKKVHKLKASNEDDVLEKALTKFFGLDDIKDVISVFQRRHLICAGLASSETESELDPQILDALRQAIFEDTRAKLLKDWRVNIDADVALQFLSISLQPKPADQET